MSDDKDIDGVIRDLAEAHGHDNVSTESIQEVRSTLSHDFIDGMLDAPAEQTSSEEALDDDGKA